MTLPISPAFERLAVFFRSKEARTILTECEPPAPAATLATLRALMPEPHLEPLWAMYGRWNGSGESSWFSIDPQLAAPPLRWITAERCLDNSRGYAKTYGGTCEDPRFALFGYFDGGALLAVDRASGAVSFFGPAIDGADAAQCHLADSLESWLTKLADLVESGARVCDEDEGTFVDGELPPDVPERSKTELADVVATNTLLSLVDFGAITLSARPSVDELARMKQALATKGGFAPRARAVHAVVTKMAGATIHGDASVFEGVLRVLG